MYLICIFLIEIMYRLITPRYSISNSPTFSPFGWCSSLPTSKTAAAICHQAPVLVHNLLCHRENKPMKARYDGYTSCPLVTGIGSLLLMEFGYPSIWLCMSMYHCLLWKSIIKWLVQPKIWKVNSLREFFSLVTFVIDFWVWIRDRFLYLFLFISLML